MSTRPSRSDRACWPSATSPTSPPRPSATRWPISRRWATSPGARVRLGEVAHLLEIGHRVADGRGGEVGEVALGQHARSDRLGRVDIFTDDGDQDLAMTDVHQPEL